MNAIDSGFRFKMEDGKKQMSQGSWLSSHKHSTAANSYVVPKRLGTPKDRTRPCDSCVRCATAGPPAFIGFVGLDLRRG